MTTRVALVASTRTGSSWLASLLDSHPAIRFHGELFNLEAAPLRALHDPLAYLDEQLVDGAGAAVVGFKLLQHQARLAYLNDFLAELDAGRESRVDWRQYFPLRPLTAAMAPALPGLWDALRRDRRYAIIHLTRRNLLRQRLSHERLMARSRARWSAAAPPTDAVTLAPEQLGAAFDQHARTVDELRAFFAGCRRLEIVYEDLVADPAGDQARILRFLDLPHAPLHPPARPHPRRSLREELANYDDVARALHGTRWQGLLEEPASARVRTRAWRAPLRRRLLNGG